jgi:hypothetical protein
VDEVNRFTREYSDGDDESGSSVEQEIDALTNKVLPALETNWVEVPPFAPEVTYMGFEMLWSYWKERAFEKLGWGESRAEDERRICLDYRRLKGEKKENYERAR